MISRQLPLDFAAASSAPAGRSDQKAAGALASVLPQVRAAMNRVADSHPSLSRDHIADRMTHLSQMAGIKLSRGNVKSIKTATVEKWLSPADTEHPPSIPAIMTFCLVMGSSEPLEPLLTALGCEVMTEEDRRLRDYAQAILDEREARKNKKKLEAEL